MNLFGDARLSLEREPPQQFDVLVLDAFNSDAIPTHLLTREAFEIYFRHLKPDGVIAVHISNRHLNLIPVMVSMTKQFRCLIINIPSQDRSSPEHPFELGPCESQPALPFVPTIIVARRAHAG